MHSATNSNARTIAGVRSNLQGVANHMLLCEMPHFLPCLGLNCSKGQRERGLSVRHSVAPWSG